MSKLSLCWPAASAATISPGPQAAAHVRTTTLGVVGSDGFNVNVYGVPGPLVATVFDLVLSPGKLIASPITCARFYPGALDHQTEVVMGRVAMLTGSRSCALCHGDRAGGRAGGRRCTCSRPPVIKRTIVGYFTSAGEYR